MAFASRTDDSESLVLRLCVSLPVRHDLSLHAFVPVFDVTVDSVPWEVTVFGHEFKS